MGEKIIVTIGKDGNVAIKADGFQGSKCVEETKAFIRALGVSTEDNKSPEYYDEVHDVQQNFLY